MCDRSTTRLTDDLQAQGGKPVMRFHLLPLELMLALICGIAAAEDIDVSGKWTGTWSAAGPRTQRGGGRLGSATQFSGPCTLEFVQTGSELAGEIHVSGRPVEPASYSA